MKKPDMTWTNEVCFRPPGAEISGNPNMPQCLPAIPEAATSVYLLFVAVALTLYTVYRRRH